MRDLLLFSTVFGLGLYALRHHYVAALLFAWVSLMNPHRLAFGPAYDFPFAQSTAILTLVVLLMSKERHAYPRHGLAGLLVVWYLWMCITSLFTFNDTAPVLEYWVKVTKIFGMLFVTLMLLRGRKHVIALVWTIVLSLGFWGFKGGIHMATGGTSIQGPTGSTIEVSNHLAVALVMTLPLIFFMSKLYRSAWLRRGMYVLMATSVLTIFGTSSRGAFLGVVAAASLLALKNNKRMLTLAVGAIVMAGIASMMPDTWFNRMEGIQHAEDHSAQSRIYTWQMIWNLALHHPITGGGFVITENPLTWQTYAVTEYAKAYSPHSIYFQVLAEHGFVGIAIFLSIWLLAWRRCGAIIRESTTPEKAWARDLARCLQASMLGYLVSGSFVNIAHYDLPFYIVSLVILTDLAVCARYRPLPSPAATRAALPAGVDREPQLGAGNARHGVHR